MNYTIPFTYTGHETFACRSYWLKKGYDFVNEDNHFNAPEAPSILGVGKNMVRSIRYWLKAFSLLEEDAPSELANKLFNSSNGWDPYLEDINTIWLLHYHLVKTSYAKIYSDLFNDFRQRQTEFSFDNFERFLKLRLQDTSINTIKTDIAVLKNNYIRPIRKKVKIEDAFSVFLQELGLIENVAGGYYHFNTRKKSSLSNNVLLFTILHNFHGKVSISFESLLNDSNSPGNVFCLSQEELYTRILEICNSTSRIVFSEDAGIRELQIDRSLHENIYYILDQYYNGR